MSEETTCLAFATICFANKPCRVHGCSVDECNCSVPEGDR